MGVGGGRAIDVLFVLRGRPGLGHIIPGLAIASEFRRRGYGVAVMTYNNACQNFPSVVVANNFGFKTAEFLEIGEERKREVPKVSFN